MGHLRRHQSLIQDLLQTKLRQPFKERPQSNPSLPRRHANPRAVPAFAPGNLQILRRGHLLPRRELRGGMPNSRPFPINQLIAP